MKRSIRCRFKKTQAADRTTRCGVAVHSDDGLALELHGKKSLASRVATVKVRKLGDQ